MNFGQLVLRKDIEIVVTKRQILRLKCTNLISAGGAYSAAPNPS